MRAATMPRVPTQLFDRRLAPLLASVLGFRCAAPASRRWPGWSPSLGIDADCVLFGHVHRLGPLDRDRPAQWRGPAGDRGSLNTGSWTYEPLLLHRRRRSIRTGPAGRC